MAQKSYELKAEIRTQAGKSVGRRLRRQDKVPAVIYGAGQEPISLTLDHNVIFEALKNEAFYSHILTLEIDNNKKEQAVLRAIQRHPYKPKLLHLDFQRISAKEKITLSVPLHFLNEEIAPGIKKGGIVSHLLTTVEISCLPANLPEYIEVDLARLDLDESLHLSDLKLPKNITLIELAHGNDLPVVSIHTPRVAEEAAPEVSAAEAEETTAELPASEEPKE